MAFQLVLGTHNAKKLREMQGLLSGIDVEIRSLAEIENAIEVVEDGSSFLENAELKASVQARHLGQWVLGEDSGLSVDALDGAPGIYSARFSGPDATDASNNQLLLDRLDGLPPAKRHAWYTSHLSLSDPNGEIQISCQATCHGRIVQQPRGTSGFGYDPLFELREYHATFAELGIGVKSVLSHRGRALRKFLPEFQRLLDRVDR